MDVHDRVGVTFLVDHVWFGELDGDGLDEFSDLDELGFFGQDALFGLLVDDVAGAFGGEVSDGGGWDFVMGGRGSATFL